MKAEACDTCYYGREFNPLNENVVECHRYPPRVTNALSNIVTAHFAPVARATWCGEWKATIALRRTKSAS